MIALPVAKRDFALFRDSFQASGYWGFFLG